MTGLGGVNVTSGSPQLRCTPRGDEAINENPFPNSRLMDLSLSSVDYLILA
jgi:hypothetical protein